MKKILIYLIAFVCSFSARAQSIVYLQGNVSASYSNGYDWEQPGNQDALDAVLGQATGRTLNWKL
ncbi:MAG: hypothetical protein WKG06_27000 [Segetibacter sp.]